MNYDEIKKIIDDMGNSKLDELHIEFPDGVKISMKKNSSNVKAVELKQIETETTVNVNNGEGVSDECFKLIKAPMVGTFYQSPSPNEKPFVKVGDKVKKGQVLCIIEAMKLMNEIESEFDGEIAEICINDGDLVDYGKVLFKIK